MILESEIKWYKQTNHPTPPSLKLIIGKSLLTIFPIPPSSIPCPPYPCHPNKTFPPPPLAHMEQIVFLRGKLPHPAQPGSHSLEFTYHQGLSPFAWSAGRSHWSMGRIISPIGLFYIEFMKAFLGVCVITPWLLNVGSMVQSRVANDVSHVSRAARILYSSDDRGLQLLGQMEYRRSSYCINECSTIFYFVGTSDPHNHPCTLTRRLSPRGRVSKGDAKHASYTIPNVPTSINYSIKSNIPPAPLQGEFSLLQPLPRKFQKDDTWSSSSRQRRNGDGIRRQGNPIYSPRCTYRDRLEIAGDMA